MEKLLGRLTSENHGAIIMHLNQLFSTTDLLLLPAQCGTDLRAPRDMAHCYRSYLRLSECRLDITIIHRVGDHIPGILSSLQVMTSRLDLRFPFPLIIDALKPDSPLLVYRTNIYVNVSTSLYLY